MFPQPGTESAETSRTLEQTLRTIGHERYNSGRLGKKSGGAIIQPDDGLVHCRTEQEAEVFKARLQARLTECRLELHPIKTKIVYCRDGKRRGKYPNVTFDFLGYCFRPRLVQNSRDNTLFCGFTPAVSVSAMKAMRTTIRELGLRHRTELSMADIARQINPLLRGWIAYYGRYAPSAQSVMDVIAAPADSPVMKTHRRSIPLSITIFSTICRMDNASPLPRWISPASNQLKQPLGLLDRCCSGSSRAKP